MQYSCDTLLSNMHEEDIILTAAFPLMFVKTTINYRVASHQLPVKCPQLLALLVGLIETLIYGVYTYRSQMSPRSSRCI